MTIRKSTYLMRAIVDARRPTMVIVLAAAAAIAMVAQAAHLPRTSRQPATAATAGVERAAPVRTTGDRGAKTEAAPLTAELRLSPAIKLLPPDADVARAELPSETKASRPARPGSRRARRHLAARRRDRIENKCRRNDPLCGLGSNRLR